MLDQFLQLTDPFSLNNFILPLFVSFCGAILTAFLCSSKEKTTPANYYDLPTPKQPGSSFCANLSAVNKVESITQKLASEKIVSVAVSTQMPKTQLEQLKGPSDKIAPSQGPPRLTASAPGQSSKGFQQAAQQPTNVRESCALLDGAKENVVDAGVTKEIPTPRINSTEQIVSFPIPAVPYVAFEKFSGMSDTTEEESIEAARASGKQISKERNAESFKLPDEKQLRFRASGPSRPDTETQRHSQPLGQPLGAQFGQPLKQPHRNPKMYEKEKNPARKISLDPEAKMNVKRIQIVEKSGFSGEPEELMPMKQIKAAKSILKKN